MDDLRYLRMNLVMIGLSVALMFIDLLDGAVWFALMVALAAVRWYRWRTWPRRVR